MMRFLEDEVYVYHYKLIMKDDKNAPPTDEGLAENTWEWHQVRPFEPIFARFLMQLRADFRRKPSSLLVDFGTLLPFGFG